MFSNLEVNEAVRIEMSKADCVMNSKAEFHQAPLVRVVPVTGLLEDQEAGADPRQPGKRQRTWEKSRREEAAWQLNTLVKC